MRTRSRITIAGLALGVALAGGVAWATIPNDGNVYTACMLKATGTIRLVDTSLPSSSLLGHCTSVEKAVSWNQQGIPGLKGDRGDRGADGLNGTNGTSGTDGTNGTIGPKGDKGDKGDQGLAGGLAGYEVITVPFFQTSHCVPDRCDMTDGDSCPAGKKVITGGVTLTGDLTGVTMTENGPTPAGDGWTVKVGGPASGFIRPWDVEVRMICASV